MSIPRRPLVIALLLAVPGAAACAGAWAQDRGPAPVGARFNANGYDARNAARGGDPTSLSDAVRRVQRSTGGEILSAERVPFEGRDINRVKYLDDSGRVRWVDDPQPPRPQGSRGRRQGGEPRNEPRRPDRSGRD